jgi:hypothetical protein
VVTKRLSEREYHPRWTIVSLQFGSREWFVEPPGPASASPREVGYDSSGIFDTFEEALTAYLEGAKA